MALSTGENDVPMGSPTTEALAGATPAPPPEDAEPEKQLPVFEQATPYFSTRGRKAPNEWGQPDHILYGARRYPGLSPSPWMPQTNDIRDLVRRNARFLIQNGSRPTQMLAAKMAVHNNKWWEEYAKGKHAQAQEARDEYRLNQEKLVQNQNNEFRLLSDAFTAHKNDPNKLKNALLDLSYRFDDPVLRDVIESQGIQRAEELISSRHNNNLDQLKIIHQRMQNDKLKSESDRTDTLADDIAKLTDPNAQTSAVQDYVRTGEPDPLAVPKTPIEGDAGAPAGGLVPGQTTPLPTTTPATHADVHASQTSAAISPPPFPSGITPQNAPSRRGELTDWANATGVPIPPADAVGFASWLAAHVPSGPVAASPTPTATTPATPTPATGASPAAQRIAPMIGYTPHQLDRAAWDYLIYNRMPPHLVGAVPKSMTNKYALEKRGIEAVATGAGGLEDQIEGIYRNVGTAPQGLTERESVARADGLIDKISQLNSELGGQIRAIVHGASKLPAAGFGATARGPQYIRGLVYAVDPTYNEGRQLEYTRTRQAFSGTGQYGQRVSAFKTAINHMTTMMEIVDQMPNSASTDYNRFINSMRTRLGDPSVTRFNTAFQLFSTEVARSFRGSQTTLSEINHIKDNLSANASPAQMRAGLRVMAELMQGQLDSLADTYNTGTMLNKKGEDLFADPTYMQRFRRILALPTTGAVGLNDLGHYLTIGKEPPQDMPQEALDLNAWLEANPASPKAAALRAKLQSLGWLAK